MKLINIGILACSVAIANESTALTYPWLVATQVDVNVTGPTSAKYTLHMDRIDITDESITETSTVQEVMDAHGVANIHGYRWGTYHRHNSDPEPVAGGVDNAVGADPTDKFKSFAEQIAGQSRILYTVHNNSEVGSECVGSTVVGDTTLRPFEEWLERTWNGGAGAAGECLGTPPASQWCAMTTPGITFEYGTMKLIDAFGAKKTTNVEVFCTLGMKYTVRLQGANSIKLSNGMKAELTANNNPLGNPMTGQSGTNSVSISSTLEGTPSNLGAFSGTGVLFISYP